jgi:GH15 family glucan-1,4-alpha-glucosidase
MTAPSLGRAVIRIEDYALLGDTHSAGLVSIDGSIDWLCLPRFDSGAVFAALLDGDRGGRWRLAPSRPLRARRSYREDSMVLETIFETSGGSAMVIDCLPLEERSDPRMPRHAFPHEVVVRVVRGLHGTTQFDMSFEPRFDYGFVMPWFRRADGGIEAVGGPDAFMLRSDVALRLHDDSATASFSVQQGESRAFVASYHPSHMSVTKPIQPSDVPHLIEATERYWKRWAARCRYSGMWNGSTSARACWNVYAMLGMAGSSG